MSEERAMRRSLERRIGVGMVLVAAVFIALAPNAAKIAYQSGANPIAVLTFRCVLAMIGLGIFMFSTGRSVKFVSSEIGYGPLTGMAQALGSLGLLAAVVYIDVGLAFLIVFFHPFLIALVEHYRGNIRLTLAKSSLIILALAGLAMAISVDLDITSFVGVGLAILGAIASAAMVISVSEVVQKTDVVSATFSMMTWASLYFVVASQVGPWLGLLESMALPTTSVGWIGLLGTGATFTIGYLSFFAGAQVIGISRASIMSILEPVLAILFAMYLVNEWLTLTQWLGVALVVGSLAVMETRETGAGGSDESN